MGPEPGRETFVMIKQTLQCAICSIVRASFSEILNHQTTKMTKIVLLFLVLAVVSVTFANGKTCWKSCTGKIIRGIAQ